MLLVCDFCGESCKERDDLQIVEFLCFDEPALKNESPLWGACDPCATLIAAGSWVALMLRSQMTHQLRGERTIADGPRYDALRRNHVGGPRSWRPSDYEGWT